MAMPAGWKPDPVKAALGGEKVLWKREITKGLFRRQVVGVLAVTNRHVVAPGAQVPLQDIDAVVARNRREMTKHSGTMKARPGSRYGHDEIELETETRVVGDVAFIRDGVPIIVFENLDDPDYLVGLATAARDHVLGVIGPLAPEKGPVACAKCGMQSPDGASFCGHCGAALS